MRRADTRALGQLTARSGGPRLPGRGNGKGRKGGGLGHEGGGTGHEGGREAASEPGAKFLSNGTAGGATRGRAGTEPPSPCSHTALAWGIQGQRPLGGN